VRVASHTVDDAPGRFLSFVSSGLAAHGQREIIVTLLRRSDEVVAALPQPLLDYFVQVHAFAEKGRLVGPGAWTEFGTDFLAAGIRGVAYADAPQIKDVEIPMNALAGILLTSSEMRVVKTCGVFRVLSRLGEARRYYPFPFWCDRDRQSVVPEGVEEASLLARVRSFRAAGASVLLEQDQNCLKLLVVTTGSSDLKGKLDQVPPNQAMAILTEPAPEADGWFFWRPGQKERGAITPPGSRGARLTGFHLIIAPGVEVDGVTPHEDGFALTLRAESWTRFKEALERRGRFEITPPANGLRFELVWIQTEYRNPVDGQVFHSGGWREYGPVGDGKGGASVRLLTSQNEIQTAVGVEPLTTYCKAILTVAEQSLRPVGIRRTIYFQFELAPGSPPSLKTACDPAGVVPEDVLKQMMALSAPVARGVVAFQVVVEQGSDA
jgi:hypothetical protein